jgi:hypothetical protein
MPDAATGIDDFSSPNTKIVGVAATRPEIDVVGGAETLAPANGRPSHRIHLKRRKSRWLHEAAQAMVDVIMRDWKTWRGRADNHGRAAESAVPLPAVGMVQGGEASDSARTSRRADCQVVER